MRDRAPTVDLQIELFLSVRAVALLPVRTNCSQANRLREKVKDAVATRGRPGTSHQARSRIGNQPAMMASVGIRRGRGLVRALLLMQPGGVLLTALGTLGKIVERHDSRGAISLLLSGSEILKA